MPVMQVQETNKVFEKRASNLTHLDCLEYEVELSQKRLFIRFSATDPALRRLCI